MKFKTVLFLLLAIFLIFVSYFFIGSAPKAEEIIFGVNFSQKHSQKLVLDWKENYLALLDDLKVKDIKLLTHWDLIEPEKDIFYFDDLDWQVEEAEKRKAKILLVIGMKTGRWPECHIPGWATNLNREQQQKRILNLIETIVLRYQDSSSITTWDVENEPLFPFGECPWIDKDFLKEEINLVKSLDPKRPILISDSGEGSFWIQAAKLGDIVGTTMYRKVWFPKPGIYINYYFPPVFYWRKVQLIEKIFKKEVINVELQAEPWCPSLLYDCSLEEQQKTMDLGQFRDNIEFAKKTGLDEFYLWGSEWWYWLKENQNQPDIWKEAKGLF